MARLALPAFVLNMPLRLRLSIPFFILACMGTFLLVLLGIRSQNALIVRGERHSLFNSYHALVRSLDQQGRWAVSLASTFAQNPEVAEALERQDRARLIALCYPAYLFMRDTYGIAQFHFQTLPPRSFLRLHRLYEFGDDLRDRRGLQDVVNRREAVYGLEEGLTGWGIRGMAPVIYEGTLVGTVEIGFDFGRVFVEQAKHQLGVETSVIIPQEGGKSFRVLATTFPLPAPGGETEGDAILRSVLADGRPRFVTHRIGNIPYASLIGPVTNYAGETVALVHVSSERKETFDLINRYRAWMIALGILGLILSAFLTYAIAWAFTRPIGRMIAIARRIAEGERGLRLVPRPSGEIGDLSRALEEMLASLETSEEKVRAYTENLENMVRVRTHALLESETKYRTLVENVPLVVYRLLGTGKTIFVNCAVEEITGLAPRKVLEDPEFWKNKVYEEDRERVWPLMEKCLAEGVEFSSEYRVRHADGRFFFVLDNALPVKDDRGEVETVDGFLVDVTDRYRLLQQRRQTEELQTLAEISARLAHEIRNPLMAAGGFARRLMKKLPEDDPRAGEVKIIVAEIGRLEQLLERSLAYLRPFEVVTGPDSVNEAARGALATVEPLLRGREIEVETHFWEGAPSVMLDPVLFRNALESFVSCMAGYGKAGSRFVARTSPGEHAVRLELTLTGAKVSEDDLEHFFYPFTSHAATHDRGVDLFLAKLIVQKHRGVVELKRKGEGDLVLSVTMPE